MIISTVQNFVEQARKIITLLLFDWRTSAKLQEDQEVIKCTHNYFNLLKKNLFCMELELNGNWFASQGRSILMATQPVEHVC